MWVRKTEPKPVPQGIRFHVFGGSGWPLHLDMLVRLVVEGEGLALIIDKQEDVFSTYPSRPMERQVMMPQARCRKAR
jgi:hypothetical protein